MRWGTRDQATQTPNTKERERGRKKSSNERRKAITTKVFLVHDGAVHLMVWNFSTNTKVTTSGVAGVPSFKNWTAEGAVTEVTSQLECGKYI